MKTNPDASIYNHLPTLQILIETNKLKTILEIGVEGGNSTITILESLNKTKGTLYSIDILPLQFHLLPLQKLHQNWEFIQHDSLTFDTRYFPKMDLLFIDSKHTREQLETELKKYSPLLKHGCFIVLHDVNPDVVPEMNEVFQEFIIKKGIKNYWYYENNNGLGIIQVD